MSGSKKQQDQGADIDDLIDQAKKCLDTWKKAIDDIAKDLAKLDDGKSGGGGKGGKDDAKDSKGPKKIQSQAEQDAEAASKKLNEDLKKMLSGQKPPSDPKEGAKLPDFIGKFVDKNGVKLKDWGSVAPDVDIDFKKMELKKFGLKWTWDWK